MDSKLQNLGLAYKARKLIIGEDILDNLTKVKLLFIAKDISPSSKQRYLKKCNSYNIDYIDTYLTSDLSKALGKNNVKCIALVDEGFKKIFMK